MYTYIVYYIILCDITPQDEMSKSLQLGILGAARNVPPPPRHPPLALIALCRDV